MSNSLLAAALSALTENTIITHDDYAKRVNGDDAYYNELDQKSLHQSHLVGGRVPTSERFETRLCSYSTRSVPNERP